MKLKRGKRFAPRCEAARYDAGKMRVTLERRCTTGSMT